MNQVGNTDTCIVGAINHHGVEFPEQTEFLSKLEALMDEYEVIKLDVAIDPYKFVRSEMQT